MLEGVGREVGEGRDSLWSRTSIIVGSLCSAWIEYRNE